MTFDADLRAAMQERLLGARPRLPAQPHDVHHDLVRRLLTACEDGKLQTPPFRVRKLLRRFPGKGRHRVVIEAGTKGWDCAPGTEALQRADGAWFTFRIEVVSTSAELSLEAYAFQLCFPIGSTPASIRFELEARILRHTPEGFELEAPTSRHTPEGLRSHITPGHPELRIPAPVLSPAEWLDLILYSLPSPPTEQTA